MDVSRRTTEPAAANSADAAPVGPGEASAAKSHIFFDGSGRRALLTNVVLFAAVLALCSGMAVVAYGVVNAPQLRALVSAALDPAPVAVPHVARRDGEPRLVAARNRHPGEAARKALRLAFYSEEDTEGYISLIRNAASLDGIMPDWLEVNSTGGRLEVTATIVESLALPWIKRHAPDLAIYPQLTANVATRDIMRRLVSPAERQAMVDLIAAQLDTLGAAGIAVDFDGAVPTGQRDLLLFLRQLDDALRQDGRTVIAIADAGADGSALAATAAVADYVLVQSHDHTGLRTWAGPTASQGWFEDQLARVLRVVPRDKLILSIGSFGNEWDAHGARKLISVQQAWDLMVQTDAELKLDPASLNATFDFAGKRGAQSVWLLDAVSAFNQASAALAAEPAGIAIWRLGMEDPGIWAFAGRGKLPDGETRTALETVSPGYGAFENARGALLTAGSGMEGRRQIGYNRSLGLIVSQKIEAAPRQAELRTWHAAHPKTVSLTFDDGPDPRFTAQILDILKERDAKATFYMIGSKVLQHTDLVRRMLEEGRDVGNHTFLHPNLFESGPERVAAELTATQRVFESELNVRSVLFRPPYAMTGYSYLEGAPGLATEASRLGYLFGGLDIDAFDYFVWTADQIAERVISDVLEGRGSVVLMHDAGGDRTATVKALPRIIDTLQAQGYRFVATHELVGLPRDALIQPFVPETLAGQAGNSARSTTMTLMIHLAGWLPFIAITTTALGILRLAFIMAAAMTQRERQRHAHYPPFAGSVAVLVPAYNEEKVIAKTVACLLASTIGDRLTVTVIDDGSKDRTSEVVGTMFGHDPRVRLLTRENGGKAAALNHGIAVTRADILVAIDGDTVLLPDAIERLVRPFADPGVGAVAGKVVVGNAVNLLTRFQALEYIVGQSLERTAFALFNAIGVVPGAIGAWRRSALVSVGGYSTDTLAEDGDLTISLERRGWRIVNAPEAVALTEAPETLHAFMKQRFRWLFGTLQVAFKHRGVMLKRPNGLSLITLPNIAFQFAFTLIAPIMDLALVIALASIAGGVLLSSTPVDMATLRLLGLFWLAFQAVDLLAAGVGLHLDGGRRSLSFVPLVLLQRVTYRQLLYFTAIRALLAAIKGTFVGWGKLVRTGRVAQPLT